MNDTIPDINNETYYQKNRDRLLKYQMEYHKKYYKKNKFKISEYNRQYYNKYGRNGVKCKSCEEHKQEKRKLKKKKRRIKTRNNKNECIINKENNTCNYDITIKFD